MATNTIKFLKLHYTMTQFLIIQITHARPALQLEYRISKEGSLNGTHYETLLFSS